jgi:hypothetical protein
MYLVSILYEEFWDTLYELHSSRIPSMQIDHVLIVILL